MAKSDIYLSNAMLQGVFHYANISCQFGLVLPIETYHTILANQISITDFH